jgi:hypothetical protein
VNGGMNSESKSLFQGKMELGLGGVSGAGRSRQRERSLGVRLTRCDKLE